MLNCEFCPNICYMEGCSMRRRTIDEARQYKQKQRYNKILSEILIKQTKCWFCDNKAETLHHINENYADGSRRNLLPLCRDCHIEIKHHLSEDPYATMHFQGQFSNRGGYNPSTPSIYRDKLPSEGWDTKVSGKGSHHRCRTHILLGKHINQAFDILEKEGNLDKGLLMSTAKRLAYQNN